MIRVELPFHLRTLAGVAGEVRLELEGPASQRALLDALEARYPMLQGTVRDPATGRRRPLLRLFAGGRDLSDADPDAPLPEAVERGDEPYLIVGAIAGG